MILDFYNLRVQPFGATPDAAFLFSSETHREALASLLYGIQEGRGFIGLIASPGMGKTTLLFRTLSQMQERARTVFLFQSITTPEDFLRTFLNDLGIEIPSGGGLVELQARLTQVLLEQARRGERLVVVIDEAQNLDNSVLELVRMLSNFETSKDKLMHIILSGQPQLAGKLASPDLLQLRQRISIVAHLEPFSFEETNLYIKHRLQVAGYHSDRPLFSPAALKLIAEHSGGIPRNINNLCFNAMSIGCALKKRTIDSDVLREVIADLNLDALTAVAGLSGGERARHRKRPFRWGWMPRIALLAAAFLAFSVMPETERGATAKTNAVYANAAPPVTPEPPARGTADAGNSPDANLVLTASNVGPESSSMDPAQSPRSFVADESGGSVSRSEKAQRKQIDAGEGTVALDRATYANDRVIVAPGMTFAEICAQAFTPCRAREADAIRRLNPWILDANKIRAGSILLLPRRSASDDAIQSDVHLPAVNPKRS